MAKPLYTGWRMRMRPTRAAALVKQARATGRQQILGMPLGDCPGCATSRLARHVARWLPRARRVGMLYNSDLNYPVFHVVVGPETYRLVMQPADDGQLDLLTVDQRNLWDAPEDLDALALRELEFEKVDGLDVKIQWSKRPMEMDEIVKSRALKGQHLIYLPVRKARPFAPLKVGESYKWPRYTPKQQAERGYELFWVGVVRNVRDNSLTTAKQMNDVERVLTRKLRTMGFHLRTHKKPGGREPIEPLGSAIHIADALPALVTKTSRSQNIHVPLSGQLEM